MHHVLLDLPGPFRAGVLLWLTHIDRSDEATFPFGTSLTSGNVAMTQYVRLTRVERAQIESLHRLGHIQIEIAVQIGSHQPTISRELARLARGAYGARTAQEQAGPAPSHTDAGAVAGSVSGPGAPLAQLHEAAVLHRTSVDVVSS